MNLFSEKQIKLFLEETLNEAKKALKYGDYPIGSIVVNSKGEIIAKCRNENITEDDITAHAEILCLRKLGIKKLSKDNGSEHYLFSSLEPCGGCGFFIARTNIKAIYVPCLDPYRPGVSALMRFKDFLEIFSNIELIEGTFPELSKESLSLMGDYFLSKGRDEVAIIYDKKSL
ncbi:hypothetical protein A2714_03655 [Candidatus Woesebacteria bacterium RIFCSPHIGHO2_01_FULL_38_9]|uniref:CMP/dCMP-type deaminase domain-containing protein n=2 Tax=Candidatus Woeseibacteriota TaxID=1752722 RepID=A0A1F7Y1D0_9BACT|nr:MAG: hypothetical protein A2714_03655 [Candidatus Woesebacteria bacterium RIFCSPHIGHO2_01_FULL_38_9]OGM63937.1 MAG: hypothetical protein A2893_00295 [Candidatus Woesebacteria bacterium RIFCSPLOWO2_01_FULL_39_25]